MNIMDLHASDLLDFMNETGLTPLALLNLQSFGWTVQRNDGAPLLGHQDALPAEMPK